MTKYATASHPKSHKPMLSAHPDGKCSVKEVFAGREGWILPKMWIGCRKGRMGVFTVISLHK